MTAAVNLSRGCVRRKTRAPQTVQPCTDGISWQSALGMSGRDRDGMGELDTQPVDPAQVTRRSGSELPVAGDRLGEHYRLEHVLGRGAMGTVMLAHDEQLDRRVAIKFLDLDSAESELTSLFRDEARSMARVRHPNVVQIFSFGDHHGVPYFIMEYIPGQPLSCTDVRSVEAAVSVLEQVCLGLNAIHEVGAVHNDLKPANILVGPGQRVFVTDLGLATAMERPAVAGLMGTPAYIAPEVARGEPVDPALAHRRDIYALTLVAYELLVGQRPFQAKGLQGMLAQHAYESPPRASALRSDLPPVFDDLLAHGLAKDPRERMPTAERFRRELLELSRRLGQHARPLTVMVVDDDPVARNGVVDLLAEDLPGSTILAFPDGESALRAARASPPDVVVTDLHMPGRDGFGLTQALREDPATRNAAIIVVTGLGGAQDWAVLRKLGADRFLVKPIEADSLVSAIRALAPADR